MTSSGGPPHSTAVLGWHGLCALGMAAMVLPAPPWVPRAAFLLFVAGVVWCGVAARRGGDRAAYLGLGVCCLAMVVMLVPALDWVAGDAGAGMPPAPVAHLPMPMHALMSMAAGAPMVSMAAGAGVPTAHASVPTAVLVLLAVVLAVMCLRGVVRLARSVRGRARPGTALTSLFEALLAGAMAAMLMAPMLMAAS